MLACSNLSNFTVNGYGEVFAHFLPIFFLSRSKERIILKLHISVLFSMARTDKGENIFLTHGWENGAQGYSGHMICKNPRICYHLLGPCPLPTHPS